MNLFVGGIEIGSGAWPSVKESLAKIPDKKRRKDKNWTTYPIKNHNHILIEITVNKGDNRHHKAAILC